MLSLSIKVKLGLLLRSDTSSEGTFPYKLHINYINKEKKEKKAKDNYPFMAFLKLYRLSSSTPE
jgi:hypothetical protein